MAPTSTRCTPYRNSAPQIAGTDGSCACVNAAANDVTVDATTLDTAHTRGQQLTPDWFHANDQPGLQRRWTDRLNQHSRDAAADPYRPCRHRIELATYPETVLLTAVFAAEQRTAHTARRDEAADRLTGKITWDLDVS